MSRARYAELHALSNFTFLRGASHPEELVETAATLGYEALAITDECSLSGIVRAHTAAKEYGLKKLIIGSELQLQSGRKLVVLAQNHTGYAALCSLITEARRAAEKGRYCLTQLAFEGGLPGCVVLWIPDENYDLHIDDHWVRETFRDRLWIAVEVLADGRQQHQLEKLQALGRRLHLPLVASGDVHMHRRSRRVLQDTLTAIAKAFLSIRRVLPCTRTANGICVVSRCCSTSIPPVYSKKPCISHPVSIFPSTNCATNTRRRLCRRVKLPHLICGD